MFGKEFTRIRAGGREMIMVYEPLQIVLAKQLNKIY
jgi:hypothetical protein